MITQKVDTSREAVELEIRWIERINPEHTSIPVIRALLAERDALRAAINDAGLLYGKSIKDHILARAKMTP